MKKRLAVHKNVSGCQISEMIDEVTGEHYFIATILGWGNFRFFSRNGEKATPLFEKVIKKVTGFRTMIEKDEDAVDDLPSIFYL